MFPQRQTARLLLLGPLLVLFAGAMGGCGGEPDGDADTPQVWRFAIEEAEGSVQHAYALKFKELIEERTSGDVKVIVYPYGTLGTSTQLTEQLRMGMLQFSMASPGSLGKFIPELQVFLLHFLLSNDEYVNKKLLRDAEVMSRFDQLYAPKGLKLLSIFSEGEMVWTVNKEIRSPDDFRGVKMRVMTTPLLLRAYGAYGASPTPMPYSEVYSGLQLNMIDGQVNPVFAIERQKFHEVTSWMIFPGHLTFITTCAANREFFDSLPSDRRKIVQDTIAEMDDYIFDLQLEYQQARLKVILESKKSRDGKLNICGSIDTLAMSFTPKERAALIDENPGLAVTPELTDAERDKFRDAAETVWSQFSKMGGEHGQEVLDLLIKKREEYASP